MRAHGPERASAPPTIDQTETLNRLGESLMATRGIPVGYAAAIANIRPIMDAEMVELHVDESGSGGFAKDGALVFASGEGQGPGEAAERIAELHRPEDGAERLVLRVTGAAPLLPSQTATHLVMVLNELIQNAVDHGLGGGGTKVSVDLDCARDHVSLSVRDEGPGLGSDLDLTGADHLGLLVTKLLVEEDLRGTLSLGPANPASEMRPGLKAELRFP